MNYAFYQLARQEDAFEWNCVQAWKAMMNQAGICRALQAAVLDPEFEDIRTTGNCKFWVYEAMRAAYAMLEDLDTQLRLEMARRKSITPCLSPTTILTSCTVCHWAARDTGILAPARTSRRKVKSLTDIRHVAQADGGNVRDRGSANCRTERHARKHVEEFPVVRRRAVDCCRAAFSHKALLRLGFETQQVQVCDSERDGVQGSVGRPCRSIPA